MTARDAALFDLDAKPLPGWPAGVVKGRRAPLADPRDRGLAEQITTGVVKNLLLLQHLAAHYSGRNLAGIDPIVQKIVAIGLYQLRFLDRVPASAAVDEAVEQAKRFGHGRAGGFVNAVLRNATRDPHPPLPSASADPSEYARVVLSHPPELFAALASLRGTEAALALCVHDNAEPPTIVRLFRGVDPAALAAPGVVIRPHGARTPDASELSAARLFVVEGAKQPTLADWARRGVAQVQDPTAADVISHLDVRPGHRVLDRCCGLGTKTLQASELAGDAGSIVAVDPSHERCEGLRRLLADRGIRNVVVIQTGMLTPTRDAVGPAFDRILVDAPCGNSGVLARRPEARYAQGKTALRSLADLQGRILHDTADWLLPGGLMAYSTCSIRPEENESRVAAFLEKRLDFTKVEEKSTWPQSGDGPAQYHDGGYWALLRRAASDGRERG